MSTAIVELRARYAGTLLGAFWIILYPMLFLAIYVFLYLVVFKIRFPGLGRLDFVVYVFSGLIPFLIVSDCVSRAPALLKENVHLIRNIIMPINLLPMRLVAVSLIGQTAGLVFLIAFAYIDNDLSIRAFLFPVSIFFLLLQILGVVYLLCGVGLLFPDVAQIANLALTILMFLSPIAFKTDMVPSDLQAVVYLNPISYPLEAIRWCLLSSYEPDYWRLAGFPVLAVLTFNLGLAFFHRFESLIVDHV